MSEQISIGEAARRSGVKVPTIRYYEQIGLLPAPERTEGNRRNYRKDEVQRLAFIRHSRELGFEIDAIKTLLVLQDDPNQPCGTADQIVIARLQDVDQRINSLNALKVELETMLEQCSHGRVKECRVIETLANHDRCIHGHH
ncbi:helix-turn-helix domain-containing protein [Phyllobacterium sp. BT25]|uniref:Helix-turn-helix domain-containing protein n=1 Tax=Phyllobacterium pellucidum TaxID=2740464 RepID=A0A849VQM7_9HYPH|nr:MULTISPECIES: helix-turn-helix domain-containing protein [Phyllobacterium]NTS32252.1 helix-turn-helix domain-containing protein [Phyllobacterium pellucidum]UGY09662.1 helix-turn-helix domain-containing protein [Phyllobacterium sp. T1018]SFI83326.1 DNA-binding transcriptional regulator, MerR family [Phyllobacterium sp. CL33Tsu]